MKKTKSAFSLIELSVVILVIGLLVIGITKGSRIVNSAKTTQVSALTKSSPAASMEGLVMWYDATSKDSYTNPTTIKSGDTITTLKDINPQSNNKNNLTGTATYLENSINGLPVIDFNGSSQYFDSTVSNSASGAFTIVTVLKADDVATLSGIVTSYGTWKAGSIHFNTNGSTFELAISPGGGSDMNTSTVKINTPYILTMTCNSAGLITGYINSISSGTYSNAQNAGTNLNFTIGSWFDGASRARFFNGKIGEIIVFNRLIKTAERQAVESYLSNKWSIALNKITLLSPRHTDWGSPQGGAGLAPFPYPEGIKA